MLTAESLALRFIPEERALWHLELLGCYQPEDARTPSPFDEDPEYECNYDDYDDEWSCTHCGGEGWAEVDDPLWDECDEFGYGPCEACRGTGERRHQWVF